MSDFSTNAGGYGSGAASTTLTAFFDTRAEANRAVERLRQAGVSEGSIRMTEGADPSGSDTTRASDTRGSEDRGFFESLGDMFFPTEDRQAYAEGLSRGGYLVSVSGLSAEQYDEALDILDDEGAVDLDAREESWRSEGWSGHQVESGSAGMVGSGAAQRDLGGEGPGLAEGERTLGEGETVPVIEEKLRVGKRDTSHGRVRVRSYVRETPVSEEVELTEQRVTIERRPVDRALNAGDDAFRERTIEAEEFGEVAVTSKEARVVEEIGLRRESETHRETVTGVERHTEVEIEDERDDSGVDRTNNPVR